MTRFEVEATVDGVYEQWTIDTDTLEEAKIAYRTEAETGVTSSGCQRPIRHYELIDIRIGRTKDQLLAELFGDLFSADSTQVRKPR